MITDDPHYRWTVAPSGYWCVTWVGPSGQAKILESGMASTQEGGRQVALAVIKRKRESRRDVLRGTTIQGVVPE